MNISSKQKINTRSSTEAELVGVNDAMALVLWCRLFIMGQGFDVHDNIVFQDNQSTMLLSTNGRHSSGKKTRHIEIRYYFITDHVRRKNIKIACCPTEEMVSDFFTKPLQGSQFRRFRNFILNIDHDGGPVGPQECVGTPSTSTTTESRVELDVAKGVALKSWTPWICSCADRFGLIRDVRNIFRVSSAWSRRRHHKCSGKFLSTEHKPLIKLFLNVCMARSAMLRL